MSAACAGSSIGDLPIIQYWHEKEPPGYLEEALDSFGRHNPERPHLVFNKTSAEALIEEHFSNRELSAFQACALPTMQSDYFRYCAVYALGGVYSDVDFACAAPLHTLLEDAEGQLFRLPIGLATSAFFAFRSAGHPFLRLAIDISTENIERGYLKRAAGSTGPMVFTGAILMREQGSIDAFLRVCGNSADWWQPRLMSEVVGAYERLERAFRGVQIGDVHELEAYVKNLEISRVGKKQWAQWQSSTL